jgi:hypothetical protein
VKAEYIRTERGTRYVPGHWSNQRVVVERHRDNGRRRDRTEHERERERDGDRRD